MAFIDVKEASQKWGISERLIQRYCTQGRIEGAMKIGNSWAIPEDASKPEDPRKAIQKENKKEIVFPSGHVAFPLLNTPYIVGNCLKTIDYIKDQNMRELALCEYYYFSGQAKKATEIASKFIQHSNIKIQLTACWIYGYASFAQNNIDEAKKVLIHVKQMITTLNEDTPKEIQALIVLTVTGASVLLHLPIPDNIPNLKDYIYLLPPGLRLFALYIQGHYAYLQKEYSASIGIVETALALQEKVYPITNIYLHLVATMDYMSLRRLDQAKTHLLAAWDLAKKDDLIEPFGEHHGLLGGLLEAVIKKEYPEDFKRIIAITYSFSAGWRKIHNPVTGDDVADDLTTTEFTVAMLAARGWTNQEIGDHLGVSLNTVKQHISSALQKLHITQRKELKKYMLQ